MSYTAQQLMQALQQRYPGLDLNIGNLPNELNRRAAEGATPDQILNDAPGYSEIPIAQRNQYLHRIGPQLDTLDQGIKNIQKQKEQDNLAFENGMTDYRTTQANERGQFMNDQANNGVLGSGSTNSGLTALELKRANDLSALALQHEQNQGTLDSSLSSAEKNREQLASGTGNDIFTQGITQAQLESQLPAGMTYTIGGQSYQGKNMDVNSISSLFSNPFLISQLPDDLLSQILRYWGHNPTH